MHDLFARRDDVIEDYHGTKVADPYRWLENPASADTLAWVETQNAITSQYISAIPARAKIQARMTALWDYPKYSVPVKRGDRYFFHKNTGLQDQSVLYRQDTLQGEAVVVIDPNTFSEDGTAALTNQAFSEDGGLLAYGISSSGSDWQEIKIRQVDKGTDYPEVIRWCKFSSIAWRHDNQGFFYNRLPEPGTVPEEDQSNFSQVYWHTPGTPQTEDQHSFACWTQPMPAITLLATTAPSSISIPTWMPRVAVSLPSILSIQIERTGRNSFPNKKT